MQNKYYVILLSILYNFVPSQQLEKYNQNITDIRADVLYIFMQGNIYMYMYTKYFSFKLHHIILSSQNLSQIRLLSSNINITIHILFGFSVKIDAMEQELPSEPDQIQVVSESPSASVEERVGEIKQSSERKMGASFESDTLLTIQKGTAVKVQKRCVKYY